jgi:hypothetical protein
VAGLLVERFWTPVEGWWGLEMETIVSTPVELKYDGCSEEGSLESLIEGFVFWNDEGRSSVRSVELKEERSSVPSYSSEGLLTRWSSLRISKPSGRLLLG